MKLLRKLDNYLLSECTKMYGADIGFKPHAVFLALLLMLAPFAFIFLTEFNEGFWIVFGRALTITFAVLLSYFAVLDVYLWRVLFRLRREGRNKDRNLILPESAGTIRRYAFYLAIPGYFLSFAISYFWNPDPQYMLRPAFVATVIFNALTNISAVTVLLECIRLFSKKVDSWSGVKHALVVTGVSSLLIVLRVYGHIKMHGVSVIW